MVIGRAERVRMERAHVRAWPALRREVIYGWLWRSSGGGSQRANSVSTIDFTGDDPEAAIDAVEAQCEAAGVAVWFQLFDETSPPDLAERLLRRGYHQTEAVLTLMKRPERRLPDPDVERRDHAWQTWRDVYLGQITENRREVNALILDQIPRPAAYFAVAIGRRLVATALCAIDNGCAVVECVATDVTARRLGAARRVMLALEDWAAAQGADILCLQVVQTNAAARALYDRLEYRPVARNCYYMRPAQTRG